MVTHGARWAAVAALVLIAAGAFEPFYLRIYRIDSPGFRATMAALQYSKAPGLQRFYVDVRRWTKPGERIAIWPTLPRWNQGYDYIHARAFYPLAGREVVELLRDADRPRPENLTRVDAVAAWHAVPRIPGFTVAERSADGVLLRRVP